MNEIYEGYTKALAILRKGNDPELEEFAKTCPSFPEGVDDVVHRQWIRNAIDVGAIASIEWILKKGVDMQFRDEEGYSVLHCAIDRSSEDKHKVLRMLLEHGAPIEIRGLNDWTPLHMAAARDDVKACEILVEFNANIEARTTIDNYATPWEEAAKLGSLNAAGFFADLERRKHK